MPAIPSQDAIRQMLADRVDDYRLSLGMVVGTTDGKSHLAISYGRCDAASGRRVDEATIFEIGSVTKLFTALLLAEMAGEVQLDEPVVASCPLARESQAATDGKSRFVIWLRIIPDFPGVQPT